jgi:hypothetical protein
MLRAASFKHGCDLGVARYVLPEHRDEHALLMPRKAAAGFSGRGALLGSHEAPLGDRLGRPIHERYIVRWTLALARTQDGQTLPPRRGLEPCATAPWPPGFQPPGPPLTRTYRQDWSLVRRGSEVVPGGGIAEVEAAGEVEGVFAGAEREPVGEGRLGVVVVAGPVDRDLPVVGGADVAQPTQGQDCGVFTGVGAATAVFGRGPHRPQVAPLGDLVRSPPPAIARG